MTNPITTAAGVSTTETDYTLIAKKEDLQANIVKQNEIIADAEEIIAANESLLAINEANNPLNKIYGGIKEFQLTKSMCMSMGENGMGMGQMVDSSMQLTGRELLDIGSLILSNDDGNGNAQYKPSELAAQLQEKGYNVVGDDDKTTLTYTREDGTTIQFKDANGDGQLNGMDYDFTAALTQFYADLEEYTAVKDELTAENITQESSITTAEQTNRRNSDDISSIDSELSATPTNETTTQDYDPNVDHLYESGPNGYGAIQREYGKLMDELEGLISDGSIDSTTASKAMTKIKGALDHAYVELELEEDKTQKEINKYKKKDYIRMRKVGQDNGFEYRTGDSKVDSGAYDNNSDSLDSSDDVQSESQSSSSYKQSSQIYSDDSDLISNSDNDNIVDTTQTFDASDSDYQGENENGQNSDGSSYINTESDDDDSIDITYKPISE